MSDNKIKPNELSTAVIGPLYRWTADIQYEVIALTDKKAKELSEKIKDSAPVNWRKTKRKGKYKRSWKIKTTEDSFSTYKRTVYASGEEYRLTHLLEKPHVKRNHTGTVAAQPHIAPAADTVKAEYVSEIERIIKTSQSAGGGRRSYKK